jgi:DUF4097 and DUF4098 domain-containing protein YvlB
MRSALALVALVACTGCVDIVGARFDSRYVEREEKRFTTSDKPEVSLWTYDGAIEVRPWDKSEVQVIVEKRGSDKNAVADIAVTATQNGNHIDVRVEWPRHTGISFGVSKSAKLIVSVPATTDIVARSGDGSIDVERIAGTIELRSGDGSIQARELMGDVNVQTGDGSVTLDGKFSGLRARTGDGSVRIHAASGTSIASDWDISTGDGSITLELPEGFNAELDAHTGDGDVNLHDLTLSNVTGEVRRNTVKGRLGSGGPLVRLRTGDGAIRLRRS